MVKSIVPFELAALPVNPVLVGLVVVPPVVPPDGVGSDLLLHPDKQFCKITAPTLMPTSDMNSLRSMMRLKKLFK